MLGQKLSSWLKAKKLIRLYSRWYENGSHMSGAEQHAGQEAYRTLLKMGAAAVPALVHTLSDGERGMVNNAATALGRIADNSPEAVAGSRAGKRLQRLLQDTETRSEAFWALGKMRYKPAFEHLVAELSRTAPDPNAVVALGDLGDSRAVEPLLKRWDFCPRAIAEALGKIGDRRAVEPLVSKLLSSKDVCEAANALGYLGDPRAVQPLIDKLGCNDDFLTVAEALGRLGDKRAVEPLVSWLKRMVSCDTTAYSLEPFEEHRYMVVIHALGNLRDIRAVEALIGALRVRPHTSLWMKEINWHIAETAAETLAILGDKRAVEPLFESAKEGNRKSVKALAEIGDGRILGKVLKFADECDWSNEKVPAEAVAKLGLQNRAHLVSFLSKRLEPGGSLRARRYAAEILVRVKEPPPKARVGEIVLNWLEFTADDRRGGVAYMDRDDGIKWQLDQDDGIKLMADYVGMDSKLLILAAEALGYATKVDESDKFSYSGGMDTLKRLCKLKTPWASFVLYQVARKKDVTISIAICAFMQEFTLSFDKERQFAQRELRRRGFGDKSPFGFIDREVSQ
jgi:HEAT repeat protein